MKVRLRPLALNDLGTIFAWSQDEIFCRACGWTPGLISARTDAFWTTLIERPAADFLRLGVEADGQLVGYTDLAGLDRAAGTGEFGIAIGFSGAWGRGLAREAGQLMLQHGFWKLGLTCIWAEVHASNVRSLALMERLGFQQNRTGPEQDWFKGQLVNLIRFDLSRDEFQAKASGSTGERP